MEDAPRTGHVESPQGETEVLGDLQLFLSPSGDVFPDNSQHQLPNLWANSIQMAPAQPSSCPDKAETSWSHWALLKLPLCEEIKYFYCFKLPISEVVCNIVIGKQNTDLTSTQRENHFSHWKMDKLVVSKHLWSPTINVCLLIHLFNTCMTTVIYNAQTYTFRNIS